MSPRLSADLHKQGLLTSDEALWCYGDEDRVVPNMKALFDMETKEPKF